MEKADQRRIEIIAQDQGIEDFQWIDPQRVVIGQWVREKCLYGCPRYGLKACCPPEVPSIADCRNLFQEFQAGVLFHLTKQFEDPGLRSGWAREVNKKALAFERQVFLAGFYKALVFLPAPCSICNECQPNKRECRNPSLARPTLEAYGVDVFTTARNTGYPIEVLNRYDQETNRYGLLLVE